MNHEIRWNQKQAIIERPLAEWQQPRADHMLMEERAQATMAGCRQAFGEKQGGHGVEARIVQTIHPGIGPRMSEAVTSGNVAIVLIDSVTCERQ